MRKWLGVFKEAAHEYSIDNVPRLGAALAYYSIFSIGPLLILAISIAGFVFGQEAVSGELFGQIRGLVGDQGAAAIEAIVASARKPEAAGIAGAVGIATLIFGATGVIVQLKDALNTIYEVKPAPGRGLRVFFKKYIVSLAAIMGIGFLLIVSLVVSTVLAAVGKYLTGWLPLPEAVLHLLNFVVTLALFTALIAAMFKYLPDVRLRWRDLWPGALLTSVLFMVGKLAIGLYLGKASIGSTYGAAGSFVVLLIWIYYSAQIVFFGAEFTEVYARRFGREPQPEKDAVRLTPEDKAHQGILDPGARPSPA